MKYETVKTFILVVLVGISFLLSFIIWSYRPNYEDYYDASYVNEVDVGGIELTKNDLIIPTEVIFRDDQKATGFINPNDQLLFYKNIASWMLYDYRVTNSNGRPDDKKNYVELIFPSAIPAELLMSLFTFHDEFEPPNWSFDRVFLVVDEGQDELELLIPSVDQRKEITAKIEKSDVYNELLSYMDNEEKLEEYISFGKNDHPIYLPKERVKSSSKTLIGSKIEPSSFINALFSNPSLVKPNTKEAYFTDGQRGMRIEHDGRKLEYINPIQSSYNMLDSMELLDKSINNINEHKGWTNEFLFEKINKPKNNIQFRLYYEGYPIFDNHSLSTIEQEWREQDLYLYSRPLIILGNLLNSRDVELPSGQEVSNYLVNDEQMEIENIQDIQVGYSLTFLDEAHSLMLEPNWFILYKGEWVKLNLLDNQQDLHFEGGD